MSFPVVRATSSTRVVNGRQDPSKRYGFQVMGLFTGEGMWQQFDQMFEPDKQSNFLPPGDYEVHPNGAFLDRNGRLQVGKKFVLIKAAKDA